MAVAVTVPRLGWNMDEGVFVGWLKADGDAVRAGDPLFTLEGEKATQEVEALDEGILRIPPDAPGPGDRVAVGAVLGYLMEPDEGPDSLTAVADRPAASGRPRSSPLARRVARELGIDWTSLRGAGRTGRVRKADVLAAATAAGIEAGAGTATRQPPAAARAVPLGTLRGAIAARLGHSHRTTVPVTLTATADATNLVSLREQFKARAGDILPSYTDFAVKLAALALVDHPIINSSLDGDRIVTSGEVHVGFAVETDAGLLVPVIRHADRLGLKELASRSRRLVEQARLGRLPLQDMQGGTFTVTNLGAFGVEAFTPVINPPECAILGLGRIARRPTLRGDQVVAREEMVLSLTFDHCIVDGAPAARFLRQVAQMIENPAPWLVG